MRVFAISDFHLSSVTDKPMDIFGAKWEGHWDKIRAFFADNVADDDLVLSAGDTSWGMNLSEAMPDLKKIDELPGKKFIIKGNHDYWWSSYAKINSLGLNTIRFIQNNAFEAGDYVIAGTRGWTVPSDGEATAQDKKIFDREAIRLRLTLESAQKLGKDKEIILLMHFPPFDATLSDSAFTDTIKNYPVKKVVYGHLHGNRSRYCASVIKDGVEYLLTSCDFLDFKPLLLY
ncbi:MAG: metallophosphoesterase [Christensenellales bacterium]